MQKSVLKGNDLLFGRLVVIVLATEPKVRGLNPEPGR
jgi:hypothetical protein